MFKLFQSSQNYGAHKKPTEFHPAPLEVKAAQDACFIAPFVSKAQGAAIANALRGENKERVMTQIISTATVIETMAISPEQAGLNDRATVYLHYTLRNWHWYITERGGDDNKVFGYVVLIGGGHGRAHFMEISIKALLAHGCTLDLAFAPCSLSEVKQLYRIH
ncbi:conserved hypothetical protein [Candidatus Methylobacter favarea]|uniref:Uncharacterized protein n=1 Tax=Candidatus Methylobacter favarea TaxID=2707345 RepID=A0A8S0X0T4_9GAMM|nr:hypothetical protein [Candidatus Methylobacter favarea]CAA9890788.1 conserved hypothetical protein [Candidatus Methylobacter favarea]